MVKVREIEGLIGDIEHEVALTRSFTGIDAFDTRVMDAMSRVSRHEFVPADMRAYAYENGALAIGYGQTISQPYIVALMTHLLEPRPGDVLLEVGTGSGYQAAVLSLLVAKVYSIEIVEPLALESAARLRYLGYTNVEVRAGDGGAGWPEHAPYDGIIVTAAARRVPQPLVDQLKPGRRLVIPLGLPHMHQELMVVEKGEDGMVDTRSVLGVAFVPLTGEQAT